MSDFLGNAAKKSIKKSNDDLSEAVENLSVISDDSDKTSSPKNLSDMPIDVVGLIIERSEYKEQLILRKTSKSLRSLVDKQKPACKSIIHIQYKKDISIDFTNYNVVYTGRDNKVGGINGKILRDDFEKVAFDDLASTLKHPKLQLDYFVLLGSDEEIERYYKNIEGVLESLNHQLSVKTCTMRVSHSSHLLSILPYLKPGVLKKISLMLHRNKFDPAEMAQVALLDQWKQAEELELCDIYVRFEMKYATHFKRFHFHGIFSLDQFVRIRDYLSKLDNFERCGLTNRAVVFPFDVTDHMGTLVFSRDSTGRIYHYPIPDSDYYLEFILIKPNRCIHIGKKKRSNSSS